MSLATQTRNRNEKHCLHLWLFRFVHLIAVQNYDVWVNTQKFQTIV